MVSRVLVTTALEETWPRDNAPVLFLGEWCRLFDRRHVWGEMDAVLAPYHWDDRDKLHRDYLYLQSVYEEVLQALAAKLNELHGVDHSVRYWRILVGPWLGYFIQMLFDRWCMLRKVAQEYSIGSVRIIKRCEGEGVPNDMADFSALFVDDDWNELIYGQILESLPLPVETVEVGRTASQQRVGHRSVRPTASTRIKRVLASLADRISGAFCRDDEYFFISSYLSIKNDLLLQARLGQIPKVWRPVSTPITPFNRIMRQWQIHDKNNVDDFSVFVLAMIPRHIPTVCLEGYRDLMDVTEKLPWPKRPKLIFTSNSYSSDDVFKAWTAAMVEKDVPLVIGQHGGNYGMALWGFTEDHQFAISDRFLSWGWEEPSQDKVTPIGNFKDFDRSIVHNPKGMALMVEMTMPRYSYHMYSVPVGFGQWQDYFDDQCRFVEALPAQLRTSVLVRLYAHDYGCGQEQRWCSRFPEINLDNGRKPMRDLLRQSRIYISTYNATTYLESLSLNFPTIIFWNPEHWELRDSAKPYLERLKSVGIFHASPESAARQMALVWDDIDTWWNDRETQQARIEFCDRYTNTTGNPLWAIEDLCRSLAVPRPKSA